jgi:small subunit ribosomal protein S17
MAETENTGIEQAPDADAASEAETAANASDAGQASGAAEAGSAAREPGPPPEPPKERRRRARAGKAAAKAARGPRTPEERQAERVAERRRKAGLRRDERARARQKSQEAGVIAQATPPRERGPGRQKTRQGVVVSDRADKTITVRIDVARRHRRYVKIVRTSSTLHAHDERNDAHVGDTVIVRECRPLSRTKRWRLVEVVERAE